MERWPVCIGSHICTTALWDAIRIDMRDLSSSCTTELERGGMRNSTRYDLDTTLVRPWCSIPQCFVGSKRKSKNTTLVRPWHRYDLGTTLVRPWYDLGTTATRHVYMYDCHLIGVPYTHCTELQPFDGVIEGIPYTEFKRGSALSFFGADRLRRPRQKAIHRAWGGARPQQCRY